MKRPHGYGTIFKLSGKRRKPYVVMVTTGYSYTKKGKKQNRRSIGTYKTRMEAEERLVSYNKGLVDIDKLGITFCEVKKLWEQIHYKTIGKSTQDGYEASFKSFEEIHDKPFADLRRVDYQRIINDSTLSYSAKSQRKSLLNQMYEFAILENIVYKNYAEGISVGEKAKSELHIPFTKEEIISLFNNLDVPFVDMILIQIHTGTRSIDLSNPIEYHLDENYIIGGSKTDAGRDRVIPLHKNIVDLVKNRYSKYGRLFKEEKMNSNMYRYRFNKAMDTLELNHLPHDCRHTFISIMDNSEANKVAIQRIVGHESASVTEKVYTHKDIEDLHKAMSFFPDFKNKE